MINKHKIVDCFLFYNELDMLEFRLTELNEHVDYFIILESDFDFAGNKKESIFKMNESRFDSWKEKIIHITCPELTVEIINEINVKKYSYYNSRVFKTNYINKDNIIFYMMVKLVESLFYLELDFEDIIMFSDVDEIPDFKTLNLIDEYLPFNSIILRQKRFFWTTKYIDKELSFGTSCHQYTKISRNPLVLEHFYKLKSNKKFSNNSFLDSGWHFSHFENLGNLHKKLELINGREYSLKDLKIKMNNLVPIKHFDLQDEYSLINYEGDLPKNVHLLPEQQVRRNWKRNILIKTEDIKNNGDFFQTINVFYEKDSVKKINKNTILLPKNILYGNYESIEEFQKIYGYNELKKIINNLYLLNEDTVTFDFGEPKSFTWLEIKHKYISDLI
jgi:beta-1,4-mannosyl-glycoprotein beta-1,4-N-acetylglucosaminyltransferase